MPALPPVSKVLRVDLLQSIGPNARVRDRIFLSYATAASTTDLSSLAALIATKWLSRISPNQSSAGTLIGVNLTDLTSATANQVVTTTSEAGLDCATVISAGGAAVVRFKILRRYRGGHPRFYLGGICQTEMNNAVQLKAAYSSGLATGFANFISDLVAGAPAGLGTIAHVNVSYFSGFHNVTYPSGRTRPVPTVRGTPVVDNVIGYSVNPNIASQRRRNQQSA